jgi:hypothetical protein
MSKSLKIKINLLMQNSNRLMTQFKSLGNSKIAKQYHIFWLTIGRSVSLYSGVMPDDPLVIYISFTATFESTYK